MFRKVGIVSKPGRAEMPDLLGDIIARLRAADVACEGDHETNRYLGRVGGFDRAKMPADFDLVIVLGGDGTLLSAARGVGPRQTPLLAINLGGLGFLMTTGPEDAAAAVEAVLAGRYQLQCRTVLGAVVRRGEVEIGRYHALNDIVVNKAAIARLLHLEVFVDGEFMCGYRSDGLILSTPTGSTAYSLAAGGPVMAPAVEALCVTPICPHTLSNRAVVLPRDSRVEVIFRGGDDSTYMTVDGQVGMNLAPGDRIEARQADHCVRIVQPSSFSFFDVLRKKMRWGG